MDPKSIGRSEKSEEEAGSLQMPSVLQGGSFVARLGRRENVDPTLETSLDLEEEEPDEPSRVSDYGARGDSAWLRDSI
ncbi:MAG: hypothetical protein ACYCW6_07225 [Candidatus Xenobia bacterium]